MRNGLLWAVSAMVCLSLAVPAVAGDKPVTLVGTLACAKCLLKEEGRTECQNVLMVEEDGEEATYYIAKNEAYEKIGEACKETFEVTATGTVEEKDGVLWLMATSIEPM